MYRTKTLLILLGLAILSTAVQGQSTEVIVPDVVGQPVPQAAAELNRSGLSLGSTVPFEENTDLPPNSVVTQSIAPGSVVNYGTSVNLSVVLPSNARLIYDDNDITLINLTDGQLDLSGVTFASTEGTSAAYSANNIAGRLDSSDCWQLWSISRTGPKSVAGCASTLWRTTNNTSNHFWTQSNGVSRFIVQQNGIQRATCAAAPVGSQDAPLSCEFYLAGSSTAAATVPYLQFIYTQDAIALVNTRDDAWMLTDQTTIYNYNPQLQNPGAPLIFGDAGLLREEFRLGLGDITQLAPRQCLVLTLEGAATTDLAVGCDVLAQRSLNASVAFWLADFEVESVTIGRRHTCPAAVDTAQTRCIVPR